MERETQVNFTVAKPNFEFGETEKFWSERFNREFENTLLDIFHPEDATRCKDVFGDEGWIVGYHKPIELGENMPVKRIEPFFWVLRDRDHALVGIHKEMLAKQENMTEGWDKARHLRDKRREKHG